MVMKDVATVMCWVKEASNQVITALSSSGLYLLLQGIKPYIYIAMNSIESLSNVLVYKIITCFH